MMSKVIYDIYEYTSVLPLTLTPPKHHLKQVGVTFLPEPPVRAMCTLGTSVLGGLSSWSVSCVLTTLLQGTELP